MKFRLLNSNMVVCKRIERKPASEFNVTEKEYDLITEYVGEDVEGVEVGDNVIATPTGEFTHDGETYYYTDLDNLIGVIDV
jgi:hypothetical protein